jgi:hypothetical protein
VVYKPEDTQLGRFDALKFLPDDVAGNQQSQTRVLGPAFSRTSLLRKSAHWEGKQFCLSGEAPLRPPS